MRLRLDRVVTLRWAGRDRRRRLFRATAVRLLAAHCQSGRSQTGSGERLAQAQGGRIALRRSETWLRHNIVATATHSHKMQKPWPKISLRSGEQATRRLSEWL